MNSLGGRGKPPLLAASLLAIGMALSCIVAPPWSAMAQEGTALLVNDEVTANPDLVPVEVTDPSGLGISGLTLQAPEGYTVSVVGTNLGRPRFMDFDNAGNLLVGAAGEGTVYRYPFADGLLGEPEALITGLNRPASVVLFTSDAGEYLYVGEPQQVSRYAYDPTGPVGPQEVVIADLPADAGHWTRTVAFGPDNMLYLAVGSSCNICIEDNPLRATVSRGSPDGGEVSVIATGLRNPVGLAFQPETGLLWATVNERDQQGNEIPPDLVTIVQEDAKYGWPGCVPPEASPQVEGADCTGVTPPTIGIQAHSAPLGLAFLEGGAPAGLQGDLIVAQHGSWNREPPAAPKLLLIDFEDGQPVGARDFVTGWQNEQGERWGRPVGVVVAPDGSLIVSDDAAGLLYRIAGPA